MQRIRWRLFYVVAVTAIQTITSTRGQQMQDAISMTEDGWRPIVGTRRQPTGFDQPKAITQYKNPSQNPNSDVAESDQFINISTTRAPQKLPTKSRNTIAESFNNLNIGTIQNINQGGKIPPHTKSTAPGYHTIPAGAHGPHVSSRPLQFGLKKQTLIKPTSPFFGSKRKPLRGPSASHNIRNEVYFQPPNTGFSIIKGPSNVKVRETQGLNLLGNNHFSIHQPNAHIEFTRFIAPPTNDEVFQQFKSQPLYVFSKPEFKNQNDEYTRNLVPPPPSRFSQDKGKQISKTPSRFEDSITSVTETVSKLQEFGVKQQTGLKPPQLQENLVAETSSHSEKSHLFQEPFKTKEQAVDVQVTKENFKVFHNNIPNIRHPAIHDYVDYDFHSIASPLQAPKWQTYEVTEGKWVDNPNPYTFSFRPQPPQPNSQKFRESPTARPQLVTEPLVELNVPPFLPTPYRPDVLPTSSTQSEVSTIFSQVSAKMNKYKNEMIKTNPLFFDVKEVSTHYPILGQPAFMSESTTNNLSPTNEKEENSNVTTLKSPNENSNTQKPKTRKRRPQPRRTTTTTTEDPVTESLEFQKFTDNSEISPETEKPRRRQRPRPHSIRNSSESDERFSDHITTLPTIDSEENTTEKPSRGNQRFRQRGNAGNQESRNSLQRKRIRPKITNVSNHKMIESNTPLIHSRYSGGLSGETQGVYETKYRDEVTTKLDNFEEFSHKELNQNNEEHVSSDEIVNSSSEISSFRPRDSEVDEVTERIQIDERTPSPILKETTLENTILPANEIDYTTMSPTLVPSEEEIVTISPTTTTEIATITKPSRIRNKPFKYNSSNRPRFSVKDYRQRLNQYTSTTSSTTTDFIKTTSEGIRLRFPNRLRTRPTTSTTTQMYTLDDQDETEPIIRRRFKPKDPRHSVTTTTDSTNSNIITESNIKSVNTRLRPFGRYRSTESSVTPKLSMRPNLFSIKRRPPLTLRTNTIAQTSTEAITTTNDPVEAVEVTEEVTSPATDTEDKLPTDRSPEFQVDKMNKVDLEVTSEPSESTTTDLSEDDYSKRVSDLTSSFKDEYDTPGLFKSVSPNSRRIPNYFTISTDDPILPIEAFFPNIKDKE